jgi:hypothetical protein
MQSWCTADNVNDLVTATVDVSLLEDYAAQATNLLYVMSGRRYPGLTSVVASHQISARGYVSLVPWQPVRAVTQVIVSDFPQDVGASVDPGVSVPFALSPAGTFLILSLQYRYRVATISLDVGQAPPPQALKAAAFLAANMLRGDPTYAALSGATDARQGFNISSITRQGVTYIYSNVYKSIEEGLTGIYEVDLFLRAYNPTNVRYQPKVVTA